MLCVPCLFELKNNWSLSRKWLFFLLTLLLTESYSIQLSFQIKSRWEIQIKFSFETKRPLLLLLLLLLPVPSLLKSSFEEENVQTSRKHTGDKKETVTNEKSKQTPKAVSPSTQDGLQIQEISRRELLVRLALQVRLCFSFLSCWAVPAVPQWENYWRHSLFPLPPPLYFLNLAEPWRKCCEWQISRPISRGESCKREALWDHTYPLRAPPSPTYTFFPPSQILRLSLCVTVCFVYSPTLEHNCPPIFFFFAWGPTLTCTLFQITHSYSLSSPSPLFSKSQMIAKYLICVA